MTTPHPHRELGIAFFEGKTLQYRSDVYELWISWTGKRCPDFADGDMWRIKPDEPKKIVIEAFIHEAGVINFALQGSKDSATFNNSACYKRIPELDREVTLPTKGE